MQDPDIGYENRANDVFVSGVGDTARDSLHMTASRMNWWLFAKELMTISLDIPIGGMDVEREG